MDEKPLLKLPVRSFVEFVMRSGDLNGGFRRTTSALDGIKFHQALQRERREECAGYLAEVPVSWLVEHEEFDLELGGRIDGVLEDGNGGVTIEEIKTTAAALPAKEEDTSPMHWAQAQCYAFIYAQERELPAVGIRITYVNVDTKEVVSFDKAFTLDGLRSFFS
jgi:DNA excision repair protein ERCC-2